jgi:hypothetical protein
MRALAVLALLSLAGCLSTARVEGFSATGPHSFLYSAHTNTVLTPNDDGGAERLRRRWLADALTVHSMCPAGYVIDTRRYVPDTAGRFASGGDILYSGRCL